MVPAVRATVTEHSGLATAHFHTSDLTQQPEEQKRLFMNDLLKGPALYKSIFFPLGFRETAKNQEVSDCYVILRGRGRKLTGVKSRLKFERSHWGQSLR